MSKPTPGRRVNTSVLAPLQPTFDRIIPVKSTPAILPDTRTEEILFKLYLDEKARAEHWKARTREVERKFANFRANRLAQGVGRQMKASHNPKPSGKKLTK